MKRFLIIVAAIMLICFILSGIFLSVSTQDVFEIKLPFAMNDSTRNVTSHVLLTLGLSATNIEYSDEHVTIAAGRSIYLPMSDGILINMQTAIRSHEGETKITIGIPALPLDSY